MAGWRDVWRRALHWPDAVAPGGSGGPLRRETVTLRRLTDTATLGRTVEPIVVELRRAVEPARVGLQH